MEKREGKIKDLAEKLERGEITPKEALRELGERGLVEKESWEIIPWAVYIILEGPLNFIFSEQLPAIQFPAVGIYISLVIGVLGMLSSIWVTYLHYKRGGLNHDETIVLLKDGAYQVVRHPGALGFMLIFLLLPIIISTHVPFTPLSVAAIIVLIAYMHYGVCIEERMNIEKWGNEYRQYMKDVPRYNFLRGLWNLRKRG